MMKAAVKRVGELALADKAAADEAHDRRPLTAFEREYVAAAARVKELYPKLKDENDPEGPATREAYKLLARQQVLVDSNLIRPSVNLGKRTD